MTAIAVASKTAAMDVISPVTAIAMISGLFVFCQICPMAFIAVDLTMFTLKWKVSLGIMVKCPQHPGIGIMTVAALLTHTALMRFVGFVAGEAGRIGLLELGIKVARLTSGDTVNTD